MKNFALILFSLVILSGCSTEDEYKPHVPKTEAVELNKQAMKIAMFEEGYNEKVDSAIILLQEAIKLDSLNQEARRNLVRFAYQKNDIDLVDTVTKDIFSVIEGSTGYNIDSVDVTDGMRILFTAEKDIRANGKIYKVKF